MTNRQIANAPASDYKVANQPKMLLTKSGSGGGSTRPSSGQMYPRTK